MKLISLCTLRQTVLAAACCTIIDLVLVEGQGDGNQESKEIVDEQGPGEEDESLVDNHTFVALIDIVFTDGFKRSCTGTIIDDNVVITAAHCFVAENRRVAPELTASFVVIGTKKMFDTGYEQYLPIERILTHPKFKGWAADLSLVYTFAGMTSDKPGAVVRLAGDKPSTPNGVDSNVSVLSWGRSRGVEVFLFFIYIKIQHKLEEENHHSDSSSIEDIKFRNKQRQQKRQKRVTYQQRPALRQRMPTQLKSGDTYNCNDQQSSQRASPERPALRQKMPKQLKSRDSYYDDYEQSSQRTPPERLSRYLYSIETDAQFIDKVKHAYSYSRKPYNNSFNNHKERLNIMETTRSREEMHRRDYIELSQERRRINSFKSYYKNWRRQMGSMQNKLIVEAFAFVNTQICKKIVKKAMPAVFELNDGNDVICYTSEEHVITSEDSGAPAIRHGHLMAVTVGGVENDGEHVAVGLKMSCYCSWISESLPSGSESLNCCKTCCDVHHREDNIKSNHKTHQKNKY